MDLGDDLEPEDAITSTSERVLGGPSDIHMVCIRSGARTKGLARRCSEPHSDTVSVLATFRNANRLILRRWQAPIREQRQVGAVALDVQGSR
jgi:hypothetical protein